MIHVHHLAKRFGDTDAVRAASFTVPDGVVTGLLGPNGAGKTTTLRMLSGLVRPDGGRVTVDREPLDPSSRRAARRLGVLPDAAGLYRRLTAREHLVFAALQHGLGRADARDAAERVIDRLGLAPIADRRTAGFSRGERRKVALGRALVHDPPNVVLDEPTAGLDVLAVRQLRGQLRTLADDGKAVLFSSHVMQEVAALCDRVVVMARGRVVADGTPEELTSHAGARELETAFVALIGGEEGLG